jgi:hypothetical protein
VFTVPVSIAVAAVTWVAPLFVATVSARAEPALMAAIPAAAVIRSRARIKIIIGTIALPVEPCISSSEQWRLLTLRSRWDVSRPLDVHARATGNRSFG